LEYWSIGNQITDPFRCAKSFAHTDLILDFERIGRQTEQAPCSVWRLCDVYFEGANLQIQKPKIKHTRHLESI